MHYFAAVVVPVATTDDLHDFSVRATIDQMMAPYDENRETAERKEYLEDAEEDYRSALDWANNPDSDYDSPRRDILTMLSWFHDTEYHRDEDGYYCWSTRNDQGKWDWWQLGGRWTGVWSDYDPATDERNWESCWLCEGTGRRNDLLGQQARLENPDYGCNGCSGEGIRVKWPTQWRPFAGDIILVDRFLDELRTDYKGEEDAPEDHGIRTPHALVLPDRFLESSTYVPGGPPDYGHIETDPDWLSTLRSGLEPYRGHLLAVVDYHS